MNENMTILKETLKKKIFWILSITIFSLFIAIVVAVIYMQNNRIDIENKKFHNIIHSTEKSIIQRCTNQYKYLAKRMANIQNIKDFIKNKDREGLKTFFKNKWKILKKENQYLEILHFTLPNGESFLRVHNPQIYGDKLEHIRPMVKEINKNKKTIVGCETGKLSISYRIITPIFDGDKYLGALDIGFNPNFLVEKMNSLIGSTGLVLVKKESLKFFKNKSNFSIKGFTLQTKIDNYMLELLKSIDKNYIFKDTYKFDYKDKQYTIHVNELKDYLGDVQVKLIFFQDTTSSQKARSQMFSLFIAFAFLIFIILLYFINRQMNIFGDGLEKIDKKYTDDLNHLNGILRIISNLNQNIVRIKDKDMLLNNISKSLIADHIFHSVWIALYDKDGKFNKVVVDGFKEKSIKFKEKLLNGFQPYCVKNIDQKDIFTIDNTVKSCDNCILKTLYIQDAAVVLNLKYQDKIYGVIGLSIEKKYLNNKRDNKLLAEIAEDIAFALYNIDKEQKRVKMEYLLVQNESKMQSIFKAAPIGIGMVSNRILQTVNDKFCQIVGYSKEELTGKSARIIYPSDEEYKYVGKEKYQQIKEKGTGTVETQFRRKDGTILDVLLSSTPLNPDNLMDGVTFTVLDITKQNQNLHELETQEKVMLAQSRHAAMGEMISMIAHQWRQPIATIAMEANNIMADIDLDMANIDSFRKRAKGIVSQTQHLSHTIDDFRDFFKPDKGKEKINPSKVIEDTLSVIGKSLENSNVQIVKNIECDKEIFIHSRELLQVLLNIIKNAKEALIDNNIKDKKIFITAKENKENITINICDNAGGIKDEIIDKIFDPYFSTKSEKNGTGLGLYMSKIITQKHLGGSLKVQNKDNGVCFSIKLPLVEN